jgi:iron complex outermembrane receptor protein
MRRVINWALMATTSALALSSGSTAFAQAVAGHAAASDGAAIEEVVVTARRRQESLQSVPLAVTALGTQELNRKDIRAGGDLQHAVPSLNVNSAFGQESGFVSIRGQGTTYSGTVANPGVTSYFAEVPTPGGLVTPATYFDLSNIQVLKGPQGTLFGRNSLGGAVLFEPVRPGATFGGFLQGTVGNYDRKELEGAVNIPLVEDKLLVRLSGQIARRDGYQKDYLTGQDYNNRHYGSGRLSVLWSPTENIDNYLIASHLDSKSNGSGYVLSYVDMAGLPGTVFAASSILGKPVNLGAYLAGQNARGPYSVALNSNPQGMTKIDSVQDTLTIRLNENFTLKNIASFARMKQIWAREDYDGTPFPYFDTVRTPKPLLLPLPGGGTTVSPNKLDADGDYINQQTITEELQLQGALWDNHLQFTAGGYYQKDKPRTFGTNFLEEFQLPGQGQAGHVTLTATTAETKSVYAQGTLDLAALSDSLDKLKLTLGARHTWDKVTGVSNSFLLGYPDVLVAFGVPVAPAGSCAYLPAPGDVRSGAPYDCTTIVKQRAEATTWNVSLDYQFTPNHLLYVASRHGYKGGGVNNSGPPVLRVYTPETITDVEAGFKGDWRLGDDVTLRTNLSVYYGKQKGIQRIANILYQGQNASPVLTGSEGKSYGAEFEATLIAFRRLEISGFASHNHFKYDKFIDDRTIDPVTGRVRSCAPGDPGFKFFDTRATTTGVCNSALNVHAQYTPQNKYNASVRYHLLQGGEMGDLSAGVSYVYQTSMTSGIYAAAGSDYVKGYGLLSASVDWDHVGGTQVSASVFGTNLTNQNYTQGLFNTSTTLGIVSRVIGEPLMFGARLKYEF